jgi:predicted LPLAT superfamily acyltransferase
VFEQIADFSTIDSDGEALAVREALERYVAVVERHCRMYPYNWFNFLDFWGTQS